MSSVDAFPNRFQESSRIVDIVPEGGEQDHQTGFPGQVHAADGFASGALGFDNVERITCRLRAEDHIVGVNGFHPIGTEKYKLLRYRLNRIRQARPLNSLLVTSTIPREGKTVTAVNLAVSLAMTSARVCLVDADMRKPSIHTALGIRPFAGLAEYLEGRLDLASTYRLTVPLGFCFVSAGRPTLQPVELLQSPRMREFVKEMSNTFDWLIIDSPPLDPFADGHCLAAITDGVLLVVREGFIQRRELQRSIASLNGAYVAGVVLNQTKDSQRDFYNYYYGVPSPPRHRILRAMPNLLSKGSFSKNG
ncbi:MAG TPA: CpsD/CapB family tyrosine-protein kinase [Candidatus Dormibacteraeota bacterium]|nr:CpsD/CapB family tyrosine-protein kinase [Candidatus Dormibacteraeota bacterium]